MLAGVILVIRLKRNLGNFLASSQLTMALSDQIAKMSAAICRIGRHHIISNIFVLHYNSPNIFADGLVYS